MLAAGAALFWDGHQQGCADLLEQCLTGLQRGPAGALQAEALGTVALVESYWTRSQRAEVAATQAEVLLNAERLDPPITLQLAAALRCLTGADLAGLDRQLKGTTFRDLVGAEPALSPRWPWCRPRCSSRVTSLFPPMPCCRRLDAIWPHLSSGPCSTGRWRWSSDMLGRPRAALQILESYPSGYELAVSPGDTGLGYLVATTRAQAQLTLGESRQAARGIRALLTSTSPHIGRYQIVEGLMCAALIAHSEDDQGRALEMLIRALQVADGDIRWPVVRWTDAFAAMLQRHPSVAAQWPVPLRRSDAAVEGWPRRVRSASLPVVAHRPGAGGPSLPGDGHVHRRDRRRIVRSVNTVKTHLAAIYRKLPGPQAA